MNDSVLKKEFKKTDVDRLRNLIKGKADNRSTQGVGYTKKYEYHNEGDIWEDDGKTWTIKDGIIQTVNKLSAIKKMANMPIFCPHCQNKMSYIDKDSYNIHHTCLECLAIFETELRRQGKWEEYHKHIHNDSIDKFIFEYASWVERMIEANNKSFITESGDVEKWKGGVNLSQASKGLEETIKFLENLKK